MAVCVCVSELLRTLHFHKINFMKQLDIGLIILQDVFACIMNAACICIHQADKLREGHPHSNHHLLLPVTGWSDLHVVVLKELLMEPPLGF